MVCSDSDYHSENDPVSKIDKLRQTLINVKVERPEFVYESKCDIVDSFSSTSSCSFVLLSISQFRRIRESIEKNS